MNEAYRIRVQDKSVVCLCICECKRKRITQKNIGQWTNRKRQKL